jgi:molybdopterin-binding protein
MRQTYAAIRPAALPGGTSNTGKNGGCHLPMARARAWLTNRMPHGTISAIMSIDLRSAVSASRRFGMRFRSRRFRNREYTRRRGRAALHILLKATMKLSARNQFKGKILEVKKGATTAHVRLEIAPGIIITSSITNEAVEELGLKVGGSATAVIKASSVMMAVD